MYLFDGSLQKGILLFLLASSSYAAVDKSKDGNIENKVSSSWQFDAGIRYWLSTSKYVFNLHDFTDQLISRITYNDATSNAAEGLWRLSHEQGFFLKGYFGGGSINKGSTRDEDFPVDISYSDTLGQQKSGVLNYVTVDLGYNFLNYQNWQAGGFIGYFHWMEHYNDYGCYQTAAGDFCVPSIAPEVNGMNNTAEWDALRFGINSTVRLTDKHALNTDVAYIRSNLRGNDYHNLRPDIRGFLNDGKGNGVQLDAILNWSVTQDLALGIGARWWYIFTNGFAHFEETAAFAGQAQPIDVKQYRYGLILQANYTFNNNPVIADTKEPANFSWTGFYIGANAGYGTNYDIVSIAPVSFAAQALQDFTPNALNLQRRGFIGGGQLGYNWQKDRVVAGIESDLSYAHISGSNGVSLIVDSDPDYYSQITTSTDINISRMMTLRGRLGKLAWNDFLIYVTAGPAWGKTKLAFDQREIFGDCNSVWCTRANYNKNKFGWSGGVGLEYAVDQHVSFKAEYLYVDLGAINMDSIGRSYLGAPVNYQINSRVSSNIIRAGLNYNF